ncbi:hypothetical protein O0I10_011634 [Lichtheimia ornata]|uniref:Uncharacterized protein n=1 Tax=Lichtheimia ornata TaxID=688661 RepID=A0AAD7USQ4_9FUNG|nr:uncharacterized protein O0I10_011634 [Lichtheimia ornata]KAJ8652752.1 hypothetical protein O0I10_011634 [Lichtheimia ornata]
MIETNLDVLYPIGPLDYTNDEAAWRIQIMESTTQVQDCMENLMSALDARASLLVACNQLNAALQDALAMISIAPWSVTGYLTAGHVYSLQDQHASALRTYQQMLQDVPDCHPRYHEFVKAKATEYELWSKRVDFVSRLPIDLVVSNLIPRILDDQPMLEIGKQKGYLDVCRTWRQRIALAGGIPFHIGPEDLSVDEYHRLSDIAPYLQWLSVSQEGQHEIIPKLAHYAQFTSLQRLDVKESVTRTSDQLLPALRAWSNTLRHLNLEYQRNEIPTHRYRLCDILDACANLTSISMRCNDTNLPFLFTMHYPKIIKLDLWVTQFRFNKARIAPLLKPFPRLRSLRLRPSPGSDIFPAIQRYCPRLQQLFADCVCLHLPDLPKDQGKGLRVLCVAQGIGHAKFNEDALLRFMMQHSDTLETFITGSDGLDFMARRLLDAQTTTTFNRLLHIRIPFIIRSSNLNPFLIWMVQHAPNLESIDTLWSSEQQPVIEALLEHPRFRHIGFRLPSWSEHIKKQFIMHHLSLGDRSNLQEMTIHFEGSSGSDSWLYKVPQLTQLKAFELHFDRPITIHKAIPLILKLAEACISLERLTLACDRWTIGYDLIGKIKLHPNLRRLVIDAEALEGHPSAIGSNFDGLESLHLRLYEFNWEDMDILRKRRYALTCEKRKYRNFSG